MIASKFRKRFDGPLPTRGAGSFPLRKQTNGVIVPTYPTVTGAAFWWSWQYLAYSDLVGTLANTNDQVQQWDTVPGWGDHSATALSAVLGPTKKSDGLQCDGTTTYMLAEEDIVFNGDYTVWIAYLINNVATETLVAISRNEAGAHFDSFMCNVGPPAGAGDISYAMSDTVYNAWMPNGDAALRISRFRRTGTTSYYKTYGEAEAAGAVADNNPITLNSLLARAPVAGDYPLFTSSTVRILEIAGASANYAGGSQADTDVTAMMVSLNAGLLGP